MPWKDFVLLPFPECSLVCLHTKSKTDLTRFTLCSSGRADLLLMYDNEVVECSFLCLQASAWVTWLDYKLKTWKCQDRGPALEGSQSISSCWGAWIRIQDSSDFLCYGERRTSHRGGFDHFHLNLVFILLNAHYSNFAFSLNTWSTSSRNSCFSVCWSRRSVNTLLLHQRVPTDRNLLKPSGFSLGSGKEHYMSSNSIILKDDRSV